MSVDPSKIVDQKILMKKILSQLEGNKREVVELYLLGFTHLEIGDKRGITTQRAHQIFQEATDELRGQFAKTSSKKAS